MPFGVGLGLPCGGNVRPSWNERLRTITMTATGNSDEWVPIRETAFGLRMLQSWISWVSFCIEYHRSLRYEKDLNIECLWFRLHISSILNEWQWQNVHNILSEVFKFRNVEYYSGIAVCKQSLGGRSKNVFLPVLLTKPRGSWWRCNMSHLCGRFTLRSGCEGKSIIPTLRSIQDLVIRGYVDVAHPVCLESEFKLFMIQEIFEFLYWHGRSLRRPRVGEN